MFHAVDVLRHLPCPEAVVGLGGFFFYEWAEDGGGLLASGEEFAAGKVEALCVAADQVIEALC